MRICIAVLCATLLSAGLLAQSPIVGKCDPDFEPIVGDCVYDAPEQDSLVVGIEARLDAVASESLTKQQRHDIAMEIAKGKRDFGLKPSIILSMIETESTFRPSVRERRTGATGLMQIIPKYAKSAIKEAGLSGDAKKILLNPVYNVRVGIIMLKDFKHLSNDSSKNHSRALAYYCGGARQSRTPVYVTKVQKRAIKYQSCDIG